MKNKFIYTLSALMMACVIAFSGVSGSFIQVQASSVGIEPGVWNDDVSVWENIKKYIDMFCFATGLFYNPVGFAFSHQDFYDFMIADGVSHDVAHGVFCDCDDSTHTSFTGQEHGGGGFVRDGITPTDDGGLTISDDVSDLFHDYVVDILETNCGYHYRYIYPISSNIDDFGNSEVYNAVCDYLSQNNFIYGDNFGPLSWVGVDCSFITYGSLYPSEFNENYFVLDSGSTEQFRLYDDNWDYLYLTRTGYLLTDGVFTSVRVSKDTYYFDFSNLYCLNGMYIKVFDSVSALKNYSIGQQPYYVTNNWINYGGTVNNTTVITGGEVEIYNNTNVYQTIQNNIDNSGNDDLTEQDIQDIINDTLEDLMKDSGNDSGGDSGGGSGESSAPSEETLSFYEKVLDYLDKILKQLKQIKWLNVADLVDDIISNLMEWKSDFEPVVETIMTKFPFSIPWDTMLIFGLLADEPETPRFEFPFVFEHFGINEVIVIDLEQFTTLSKISRFLLTLTFLLMLTALTRKISEWFHSSN